MNVDELYEQALARISQLPSCYFSVVRYSIGHRQLVILATPIEDEDMPLKDRRRLFMTFTGVEYMQLVPLWEESIFTLATPDERVELLEEVGLEINKLSRPPRVFYMHLGKLRNVIACATLQVSETAPEIHSYNFD